MTTPNVTSFSSIAFGRSVREFIGRRDVQLVPIMLVIAIVSAIASPDFLSSRVISSIFITAMVTTFVALGQTVVMLTKGIDLSVAPILGLAAVIVGFQAQDHGMPLWLGLLVGAGVGAVLGAGNAVLVSLLGLPPIIATLGTFSVYGGLQFIITGGSQVNQVPAEYTNLGVATNTIIPGVPMLLVVGVFATVCVGLLLRYTVYGRNVYATGDDFEAAFRAGIPTRRVIFIAYVLCGLLSGIAGVVYLARTGSADALTGTQTNENLNAIAAALIGGAALTGGRGNAAGALLGSIFLALTVSAMGIAAHIPDEWQPAGIGVLILLAVIADPRARQGGTLKGLFTGRRRRRR
ncbi:ABC transporter permease [Humibacter albus]|jgi:ribose/xylose/arabinose/galactoside ABC-type transport system permease subunit|uniref:ABC transporter permease n=1 Tax=Humibacter albus TaxID=427754 RepID=UPI0003B2EE42|nr:ABC transporter permease [Humibacter albus]